MPSARRISRQTVSEDGSPEMKNTAALNEQPSCKEMNVDELHELIEEALERQSGPDSDVQIPHSEEDLRRLWTGET